MVHKLRNLYGSPRLSPEEAQRQGNISTLAYVTLGRADTIAFLNDHHEQLGGRPLDIATASSKGFSAVEAILLARQAIRSPT